MDNELKTKVVGKIRIPQTPEECFRRRQMLQQQAEKLNPYPRPRGFIFKAKTYAEYEEWRKRQSNPRLW